MSTACVDPIDEDGDRNAAVADALAHAVEDIMLVSPQAAVRLAARVQDLLDPGDPAYARRLVIVADAHLAGGRLTTTAALLRESLRRPLPAEVAAQLRFRLVHVLVAAGQPAEALAVAEEASCVPAPGDDARAALVFALSLGDLHRAAAAALRCLDEPDGTVAAVARSVLADLSWRAGDPVRAMRLAERAVADADAVGPSVWRLLVTLGYARKLLSAGRYAEVDNCLQQVGAGLARPGTPTVYAAAPAIIEAELLLRTGRPERARETAEAALATAEEMEAGLLIPPAHAVLAAVAMRTGDLDRSQCHAELSGQRSGPWPVHHEWTQLRLAAELHGPQWAARLIAGRYRDLISRGQLLLDEPEAGIWLARLSHAVGDGRLVSQVALALDELARCDPRSPRPAVAARHADALRTNDVAALRQAVTKHTDPWERAHGLEDLGIRLASEPAPDLGEATRRLQAALRAFEELGLARDGERVRGRLRVLGMPPMPVRPMRSLWSEFSETECRIAVLVSHGYTSQQIASRVSLSVHTVNYHLRKMFRKAGVNSRSALTRLVNAEEHRPSAKES